MPRLLLDFLDDDGGATAIEYGLVGVLVSTAIVTAAIALGDQVSALYNTISTTVSQAIGGS